MVTHGVQVVIFWGTGIPLHFVFWVGPLDLGDFYGYLIRKIGTSRSKLVIPTYHSIAIYQFITHYSIICSLCLDPCDENLRDSQAYSPIKPTCVAFSHTLSKFPTVAISQSHGPSIASHTWHLRHNQPYRTSDQSRTCAFASPTNFTCSHTLFDTFPAPPSRCRTVSHSPVLHHHHVY
jgi:hypothetical protein